MGCLRDMAVWHGVVMLVASKVYAAVGGHLEVRIRDYLKVCCRQRIQVGTVDGKETLLTSVRVLLHALLIMFAHLIRGCGIQLLDRKSTRLNSSHANISYAVFCLKKKKMNLSYLI